MHFQTGIIRLHGSSCFFYQSRRSILCKGDLNENVDVQLKKCVEVKLISTYFGVEAYCNTKLLPCQQCIIFAFSFFSSIFDAYSRSDAEPNPPRIIP